MVNDHFETTALFAGDDAKQVQASFFRRRNGTTAVGNGELQVVVDLSVRRDPLCEAFDIRFAFVVGIDEDDIAGFHRVGGFDDEPIRVSVKVMLLARIDEGLAASAGLDFVAQAFVDREADIVFIVAILTGWQVIEIEVGRNLSFYGRTIRSAIPLEGAQRLALEGFD